MPWTNVFQNGYAKPEDRLTYNFLCMLELMGDFQKPFLSFLLSSLGRVEVSEQPLVKIKAVFFFSGEANPDGQIRVRLDDGTELSVFLEVKTHRRPLDKEQLQRHLYHHVTGANVLLVITPRPLDRRVILELADPRVVFVTWGGIADYLRKHISQAGYGGLVMAQFVSYAEAEGELMETQLVKEDICLLSYLAKRPDQKAKRAFEQLGEEFNFSPYFVPAQKPYWQCKDGRMGLEIQLSSPPNQRWLGFAIYYDMYDHGISLMHGTPELALFIDTHPDERRALEGISAFTKAITDLETSGFETARTTNLRFPNPWRLLWWRKPLDSYDALNAEILSDILKARLTQLRDSPGFADNFFRSE